MCILSLLALYVHFVFDVFCRFWRTFWCGLRKSWVLGVHLFCKIFFLRPNVFYYLILLLQWVMFYEFIKYTIHFCFQICSAIAYIPLTVFAVPASVLTVRTKLYFRSWFLLKCSYVFSLYIKGVDHMPNWQGNSRAW